MGLFNFFKEGVDRTQPKQELNEEELMAEAGIYRADAFGTNFNGIEDNPDAIGLDTYNKMRKTDAQIKAGLLALRLPILAKGYDFKYKERALEREANYEDHIEFVKHVFSDMSHPFDDTLDQMLTAVWAGFSVTEPVYQKITEGKFKGKLGLKKMKVLNPVNIKFKMNDLGDVLSIVQEIGDKQIKIPKEKVIHYTFDEEFQNPYGNSALYAAYNHWYIKNQVTKFSNQALERVGTPLIYGKVKNKNEVGKMRQILDSIMSRTSIAFSGADEVGVLDTTKTMPFIDYINHHNTMILRSLMIPSLLLGNDSNEKGSYALGQTHFDLFLFRLQSIQYDLETVINEKVIKRLIDINFGKQEVYPEFKFKPLMDKDRDKMSDIFFKLVNAQILEPTEDWIRDEMGMPQMSEDHKEYVQKEREIQLEEKKVKLESMKQGAEGAADGEKGGRPSDKEKGGSPTSNGTLDSGTNPMNSKGRGNLDKKEEKK